MSIFDKTYTGDEFRAELFNESDVAHIPALKLRDYLKYVAQLEREYDKLKTDNKRLTEANRNLKLSLNVVNDKLSKVNEQLESFTSVPTKQLYKVAVLEQHITFDRKA